MWVSPAAPSCAAPPVSGPGPGPGPGIAPERCDRGSTALAGLVRAGDEATRAVLPVARVPEAQKAHADLSVALHALQLAHEEAAIVAACGVCVCVCV